MVAIVITEAFITVTPVNAWLEKPGAPLISFPGWDLGDPIYNKMALFIGCPRIIRTFYFNILKEGQNNFTFRLYSAAWST